MRGLLFMCPTLLSMYLCSAYELLFEYVLDIEG